MPGPAKPEWAAIESALGAALDLPEAQRGAYLAQQPASIRAEVEALLAAHRRSDDFLSGGVAPFLPTDGAATHTYKPFTLAPGAQIGPYRIESLLGQGGMGSVYRATDTKLNRPVAIKFLSEDLADSAARRRFQREAQMASSLNHPHIVAVHDVGEFDGRQYLVTEYIDGGTLKDWSQAAKRSPREIAGLLSGVADGLAAAHSAGILHRDIKPQNILVGKNGYAKLTDFGLAKLQERSSSEDATRTVAADTTLPGTILGTIPYMSPEQASGRPADARSDIFSFGIVLHELLAGRRPFAGISDLETLQKIIHQAPDSLPATIPYPMRHAVEKALEKDPADRYQSTRDLAVDLRRLSRPSADSAPSSPQSAPAPARRGLPLTKAAWFALPVLIAAGLYLWFQRPTAQIAALPVQFNLDPPPGTIFEPPIRRQPFAISPDGTRFALIGTGPDGSRIWLRPLASTEMRPVPGTEGAESIFWSPDGRSLYFSAKNFVKQVDLGTGARRVVVEAPDHIGLGYWRAPGDLFLFIGRTDPFYEVLGENGSLRALNTGRGIRWPQFLPGGQRLIYLAWDDAGQRFRIMAANYSDLKPIPLMEGDSRPEFAPPLRAGEPGNILYIHGSSLLAQPFDADRLRLTGESFPIASDVISYGSTNSAAFSVSDNGVLVYQANFPLSELKWFDRQGNPLGAVGRPARYWGTLRISPDDSRVAAVIYNPENGGTDNWIFDANGRESRQLTFPPEQARRPVVAPDGKSLAYGRSQPNTGPTLAVYRLDGSSKVDDLSNKDHHVNALPTDWSRDSKFIAFDDGIPQESPSAWIVDAATQQYYPLLHSKKFSQWGIAFSPHMDQIAFVSTESGRPEVYLQEFDDQAGPRLKGDRHQVSKDGACLVRWSGDGRELFYLGIDNTMYAVPVSGVMQFGEPARLFKIPGTPQYGTTRDFQFDVSRDGKRFLMTTSGSVPPPPFTVIENWQDKFRR